MSQKSKKELEKNTVEDQKHLINPKYKNWIYTGIFLTVVLILFIVNNSGNAANQGPYPPGYSPVSKQTLKLSDYKGKVVILDFWATWCGPCRKGIPDLISIKNQYKNKDVEIIGVSLDGITRGGTTKNNVVPFIKQYGINYPIVNGTPTIVQQYGGISSIPTSFVIDKEGNVVSRYVGLADESTYIADIKKALASSYKNNEAVSAPEFELPLISVN